MFLPAISPFREVKMIRGVLVKPALISSALVLASASSAFALDLNLNIVNSPVTNSPNGGNFRISGNNVRVSAISFEMVVSQAARNCLPNASAQVSIQSSGTAEDLVISATGLSPNTDFDFFVIQVPNAPFGLAWYQGDLETDDKGNAMQHFRGRFNIQTFIVARPVSRRHRLSSIIRPCRMHKPGDWPGTDLPFGPVVQLADRRTKRRLPKYRDAVQWRAQCRYSGLEHVELP
jgi:hypothetical protein